MSKRGQEVQGDACDIPGTNSRQNHPQARLTWPRSPLCQRDHEPPAAGDAATCHPHAPTAVPTGSLPAPQGLGQGLRAVLLWFGPAALPQPCLPQPPAAESAGVPITSCTNPQSLFLLLALVVPFLGGWLGSTPPLAPRTQWWLQRPPGVPPLTGCCCLSALGGNQPPGCKACRVRGRGAAAAVGGRPRGPSSGCEGMGTAPQLQNMGGHQPQCARQGQTRKVPRKGQRSNALREPGSASKTPT